MKEPGTALGRRIRESRIKAGLTQAELAKKAGISLMTVRRVETTDTRITEKARIAIAEALNAPDLLPPTPEEQRKIDLLTEALARRYRIAQIEEEMKENLKQKIVQKVNALQLMEDIEVISRIVDLLLAKQEAGQDEKESGEES